MICAAKNGKANYRERIITDSLGIGKAGCNIKTECILEGELAVYSELVGRHHLDESDVLPWLT